MRLLEHFYLIAIFIVSAFSSGSESEDVTLRIYGSYPFSETVGQLTYVECSITLNGTKLNNYTDIKFSWTLSKIVEDEVKNETLEETSNYAFIVITDDMVGNSSNSYVQCSINWNGTLLYSGIYKIHVGISPEILDFGTRYDPVSELLWVTCTAKSRPPIKFTLIKGPDETKLEFNPWNILWNDTQYVENVAGFNEVFTFETPLNIYNYTDGKYTCSPFALSGHREKSMDVHTQVYITGPDIYTYLLGDEITFVCHSYMYPVSNYTVEYSWTFVYVDGESTTDLGSGISYGATNSLKWTVDDSRCNSSSQCFIRCTYSYADNKNFSTTFPIELGASAEIINLNDGPFSKYSGGIKCLAYGKPLPNMKIYRNGSLVDPIYTKHSSSVKILAKIYFNTYHRENDGNYVCIAENMHGNDTKNHTVEQKGCLGCPCYYNDLCQSFVNHSWCNSETDELSVCTCLNFLEFVEYDGVCLDKPTLGVPCTDDSYCLMGIPHSECSASDEGQNFCHCQEGYKERQGYCTSNAKLGSPCKEDYYCKSANVNFECSYTDIDYMKFCSCQSGFKEKEGECVPNNVLGSDCSTSYYCWSTVPNSKCGTLSRKCECQYYYIEFQGGCEKIARLRSPCVADSYCLLTIDNSICYRHWNNNVSECQCQDGYKEFKGNCEGPYAYLGSPCTDSLFCTDSIPGSECSFGDKPQCQCRQGFIRIAENCQEVRVNFSSKLAADLLSLVVVLLLISTRF